MFKFWGDGSQAAKDLVNQIAVRSTENFNWTFIFILAVVFYVYWSEIHKKNYDVIYAGLALYGVHWLYEIGNAVIGQLQIRIGFHQKLIIALKHPVQYQRQLIIAKLYSDEIFRIAEAIGQGDHEPVLIGHLDLLGLLIGGLVLVFGHLSRDLLDPPAFGGQYALNADIFTQAVQRKRLRQRQAGQGVLQHIG